MVRRAAQDAQGSKMTEVERATRAADSCPKLAHLRRPHKKMIQVTTPANFELRGTRPTRAHHPSCPADIGCTIGALQGAAGERVFDTQESSTTRSRASRGQR